MPISRREFVKGGLAATGALVSGLCDSAQATQSVFPEHPPLGEGQGVNPGRVAWIHKPGVVNWDGVDFWWKPENYNGPAILKMLNSGITLLTGASDAAKAWHDLFTWNNRKNGLSGAYQPGQKIAIKTNMNGAGEYNDDPAGQIASSYGNPVLLKCLLQSLVQTGGVKPADITVFDACRIFPNYMQAMCSEGDLKGVSFRHRAQGSPLDAVADRNAKIRWSRPIQGEPTWLPKCVTEARYLINLATVKGHSWGMTLAAKNQFGSFVNSDRRRTPAAAGLHPNIIDAKMGDYSVLVDLLAHKDLGAKTILWLLDGLVTAPSETGNITPSKAKWQMPPFNGDYMNSLFLSQDPIALDSVGADFLVNEPTMLRYNSGLSTNHGMENYLHEGALLPKPPSGAKYTDGAGKNPGSLGVHEHWNNAREKLYSRNRGEKRGIELVYEKIS